MPKKTPKLNAPASVAVNTPVQITGSGFPRSTAVIVVVDQIAPIFGREPSLLDKSDKAGAILVTAVFTKVGIYEIHPCIRVKRKGGSWNCRSVTPITVEAE